eukprot:TRINITY_DN2016_c0_g2_i4.p1 TRINITY_DN2016_c0_g2~~TRINITY_DN2016_c0_g2_i4.p1  ORF type:complete len:203 (-),score=40.23 TRINITY_DN2016_c0_g2_i4:160-768(-)
MSIVRERHVLFLRAHLGKLHPHYATLDISRMNILYFAVSGLDLWNALDEALPDKSPVIDWIYAQQVGEHENPGFGGFRGGPHLGLVYDCSARSAVDATPYNMGHLAMTYTALATLRILGDDYTRVHRKSIIEGLKHLQLADGSFRPMYGDCESDIRFVFCACAISFMLQDWSGVDQEKAYAFIQKCQASQSGRFPWLLPSSD